MLAAWVLVKGLQGIMCLTPAIILERRDSGKRQAGDGTQHKAKDTVPAPNRLASGKR